MFAAELIDRIASIDQRVVVAVLFAVIAGPNLLRRRRRGWFRFGRRARRVPNVGIDDPYTAKQRQEMYVRDKGKCRYCGVSVHFKSDCDWIDGCDTCFEADHRKPRSRWGRTTLANGVTACRYHNRDKGALTDQEYLASRPHR